MEVSRPWARGREMSVEGMEVGMVVIATVVAQAGPPGTGSSDLRGTSGLSTAIEIGPWEVQCRAIGSRLRTF